MGLAEDLDSTELAEKLHAQTFPDDAWSLDMLDLLRDSVHRRNQGETVLKVIVPDSYDPTTAGLPCPARKSK